MNSLTIKSLTKSTLLLTWFCLLVSCANVIPPTGGPKDNNPPVLLDSLSTPNNNNNTSRTGHNILLVFDELTEINSLKSQITSTPEIETKPIKYKAKKTYYRAANGKSQRGTIVTIDLNQDLDTNTTYVINFGNSFKDVNEGKVAENISIAFSTGTMIDSMIVKGTVKDNYTGDLKSSILVGLYQMHDTISPLTNKPKYYTSTDSKGEYQLDYIANGSYNIYAFEDKNYNKLYDPNIESIALIDTILHLDTTTITEVDLLLFKESLELPKIRKTIAYKNFMEIRFSKGLTKLKFNNLDTTKQNYHVQQDFIRIYRNSLLSDSIRLTFTDSLDNTVDSTVLLAFDSLKILKEKKPYTIDYQYTNNNITINLSFTHPILSTDLDSSYVYVKENRYLIDSISDISWNNKKTELQLKAKLAVLADTAILAFDSLTFIDNNRDTLNINKTMVRTQTGELGSISIDVESDSPNYIVYILNSKKQTITTLVSPKIIELVNQKPQDFKIKVLIDENQNGIYDNGNFLERKQPEQYINIKDKYTVKAGWEITDMKLVIKSRS